jgi:hypothetical protein
VRYPWLIVGPGGKASRTGLHVDPVVFLAQRDHHLADPAHRAKLVRDFVDGIQAADRPMLHYLHVALPHEPSVYLPSGEICLPEMMREPLIWPRNQAKADRAYQRHLLQLEFVDRWLGELTAALKQRGLYDSTLLLITADHGVSYRAGQPRRALSKENYCDILAVPLILKPPGSHAGRISDRNVELVDILPTVAELLQIDLPWPIAGRSMLADERPDREAKTVIGPYWFGLETAFFGSSERVELPARLPEACFEIARTLSMRAAPAPGCGLPRARVTN